MSGTEGGAARALGNDDAAHPSLSPLLEVGRIVKPHGLTGEVVVELYTEHAERLAPGSVLESDRGALTVRESRPYMGRHLVRFAGASDRNGAEGLRGTALRAEPLADDGVLWVHELIGAAAQTVDGRDLGRVTAVEANPASDLLVLEGGGLVPLRFVVSSVPGVEVTVDIPEGLLD